jgi:hypothetical protein
MRRSCNDEYGAQDRCDTAQQEREPERRHVDDPAHQQRTNRGAAEQCRLMKCHHPALQRRFRALLNEDPGILATWPIRGQRRRRTRPRRRGSAASLRSAGQPRNQVSIPWPRRPRRPNHGTDQNSANVASNALWPTAPRTSATPNTDPNIVAHPRASRREWSS